MIAFASACIHMHASRPVPALAFELHLSHPPSLQFVVAKGVPLYPVATILLSTAMTAPTLRFIQFDLVEV
jgi:hypothetical protein